VLTSGAYIERGDLRASLVRGDKHNDRHWRPRWQSSDDSIGLGEAGVLKGRHLVIVYEHRCSPPPATRHKDDPELVRERDRSSPNFQCAPDSVVREESAARSISPSRPSPRPDVSRSGNSPLTACHRARLLPAGASKRPLGIWQASGWPGARL